MRDGDSSERREVIVKIDDGDNGNSGCSHGGQIWWESSFQFWNEGGGENVGLNAGGGGEGFDFHRRVEVMEDPPSKLIGQFFYKQRASGDMSLDMDLEIEELQQGEKSMTPVAENPSGNRTVLSKELKVSFQPGTSSNAVEISPEPIRRRFVMESSDEEEHHRQQQQDRKSSNLRGAAADEGILRCTSNNSFQRKSGSLRAKRRSRLIDPPEQPDRRSTA